tara:strand:- start:36967 stop:38148 length:1182 start_codon:yes stop_codon:yes gene_type:complete
MFEKLKNITLFDTSAYTILGIVLGDVDTYHILEINKIKDQLTVSKSFSTKSFKEVVKAINPNSALIVNFSGKGVISKQVLPKENYLNEVLFNASPSGFYSYTLFQKEHNFVSVARKEVIDEQFQLLKTNKLTPIDFSLGVFVSYLAQPLLLEEKIRLEQVELHFSENTLVDFKNKDYSVKEYTLGTEIITSSDIPLLASLLNFLYPSSEIDYDKDFLIANIEERKFKKLFDLAAVGSIVVFFIALLGSYLLLNYFNREYVKSEEQLYHFNDNYFQIKKMEEELQNKEFIIRNSGIQNNKFLSFYIQEIAKSIPDHIILNSLQINPLERKIKVNEKVVLTPNLIMVEGSVNSSSHINEWVRELGAYKWIQKIEILDLKTNKDNTGSFILKIVLN